MLTKTSRLAFEAVGPALSGLQLGLELGVGVLRLGIPGDFVETGVRASPV